MNQEYMNNVGKLNALSIAIMALAFDQANV
jgi:hypothetical protein